MTLGPRYQERNRGRGNFATETKWGTTSFFSLPPNKRWSIIVIARGKYKETEDSEFELLRKMDETKTERQKTAEQANISKKAII